MKPQHVVSPHVTGAIERVATLAAVEWLFPVSDRHCDHCAARIGSSIAMALIPETGEILCPACGCDAQDEAKAAEERSWVGNGTLLYQGADGQYRVSRDGVPEGVDPARVWIVRSDVYDCAGGVAR